MDCRQALIERCGAGVSRLLQIAQESADSISSEVFDPQLLGPLLGKLTNKREQQAERVAVARLCVP